MDKIERIHGLKDFLKVKAPDRVEEKAFIHDLNDNPIDCNIYHPKYGYRGFVTDETRHIIASFNPIIYNDPNTNQKVYCSIEPLVILCEDENGKLSNKDGVEVKWVSFTLSNQKKLAEDENDFQEIFDYWFKEKNLNPEHQEDYTICAEFLINEVTLLQEQHLGHTNRIDKDLNLISLSNRFIKFLKLKQIDNNPIQSTKGLYLGYSFKQLKSLHQALIDKKFLKSESDLSHFISAFSDDTLADGFKPLQWFSLTKGAIFIAYFFRNKRHVWEETKHIFEPSNYKGLLSQSKGNGTFDRTISVLEEIDKNIKLLTDIDSI